MVSYVDAINEIICLQGRKATAAFTQQKNAGAKRTLLRRLVKVSLRNLWKSSEINGLQAAIKAFIQIKWK